MSLPKTFTGGERLFAEDLNDNFNDLDSRVNSVSASSTNASNLTFGTVPVERLPDVPASKIVDDGFPVRIARGTSSGSNSSSGATITFPAGRFTSAPTVQTTSTSGSNPRASTVGGVSATGFTLYTYQFNGAFNAHGVHWLAVGA